MLFCAEISDYKIVYNVLKSISFKDFAIIRPMEQGLKVTLEEMKCTETSAYLPCNLFTVYKLNSDEEIKFKISLKTFTEILNIYGDDGNPSLKLSYKSVGSTLNLLIGHPDENITVDCEIRTMNVEDFNDIGLAEECNLNKVVEDVDAYMGRTENSGNVDEVLKKLDSQHAKYKFMEYNLLSKKKRLQTQVPELKRSLTTIEKLEQQKEEFEAQFLLSDQVFAKALVPPTENVCLWLGANVMLEYTLEDAKGLLSKNIEAASKNLGYVEHDLDFLRDQFTTTEVNMARVFNWDVKRRQAAKAASGK
ncbi:unnamed protein product [Brassicogethes aeneus]|uniref:Prefoldin subunit 3 n=1 Tax=Brassicogethes aeneus TaxID=1431903 RepID=A0A9P0FFA7_BRAAE|nr:unnamed protein product [Brassicogethes aeneus]